MAKEKPKKKIVVQLLARLEHTADQYEVLVDGKRVALVCAGEGMGINFLSPKTMRLTLTPGEMIEIAEAAREQMKVINEQAAADEATLAKLVAGEPLPQ